MALHTFVAGDVLEAQQLNDSFAAVAKILQVVSTVKTDTFNTTSATFVDVTGLSVAITPSSATNKVLIIAQIANAIQAGSGFFKLSGGNTATYIGDAASSRVQSVYGGYGDALADYLGSFSIVFLDSPATTSATTYKIQAQAATTGANVYVNRSTGDGNTGNYARGASSITVLEVAA